MYFVHPVYILLQCVKKCSINQSKLFKHFFKSFTIQNDNDITITDSALTFVVPYFEEAKATIEGLIQTKKNAVKGKWKQFKVLTCTLQ